MDIPAALEPTTPSPAVQRAYGDCKFTYLDIETIPDQSPGALEKAMRCVKPPASYKKAESIEQWLAENRESAGREMLAKTSLDGGRGHVCTIGWAMNDGDVRVEHAESRAEEAGILRAFFADLPPWDCAIVGHNIARFDLPFMTKRAIILGVPLPGRNAFPRDPKPWDARLFDTMTAWAGAKDFISLNNLCGMLGIIGKEDFDGSDVADAWAAGDHMTIAHYCDADVRRVRSIHQRFLEVGF